jgi:glutamate synthase domain-containing protein 2
MNLSTEGFVIMCVCLYFICAAGKAPISIDEVEDAAEIMKRFCTGGMSLGAISREVSNPDY